MSVKLLRSKVNNDCCCFMLVKPSSDLKFPDVIKMLSLWVQWLQPRMGLGWGGVGRGGVGWGGVRLTPGCAPGGALTEQSHTTKYSLRGRSFFLHKRTVITTRCVKDVLRCDHANFPLVKQAVLIVTPCDVWLPSVIFNSHLSISNPALV